MGKYHHPSWKGDEREREKAPNVINWILNIGLKKINLSRCTHSQLHLNKGKNKNKMKK
jgi:hypothetical protein